MKTPRPPTRPRVVRDAATASIPVPPPAARSVAALVPLDPGFYAFQLAGDAGRSEATPGFALPSLQISAAPNGGGALEIADTAGRARTWLGGGHRVLFVAVAAPGGVALVTAYLDRDPAAPPLQLEISRVDSPAVSGRVITFGSAVPEAVPQSPAPLGLDVVAHIRGRGSVVFADAPWVGRVEPGLWIEAVMIVPRDPSTAAAIEYKGLSASGAETPWLASGSLCGAPGSGVPLIGFAVRQKAAADGARYDCEYSGYFASGTTAGPARNGAPCRSALGDDPLEGLQLRIAPRPPAAEAPAL